jgi:hypothetical protein
MNRTTFTRISLAVAMTAAPVAFLAAPAAAGGPHPAPLCGALNMIESSPSFYGPNAVSDGMDIAMNGLLVHGQGVNGWNNMFDAVAVSGANAQAPGCTG